jgi:hypothetical protein
VDSGNVGPNIESRADDNSITVPLLPANRFVFTERVDGIRRRHNIVELEHPYGQDMSAIGVFADLVNKGTKLDIPAQVESDDIVPEVRNIRLRSCKVRRIDGEAVIRECSQVLRRDELHGRGVNTNRQVVLGPSNIDSRSVTYL